MHGYSKSPCSGESKSFWQWGCDFITHLILLHFHPSLRHFLQKTKNGSVAFDAVWLLVKCGYKVDMAQFRSLLNNSLREGWFSSGLQQLNSGSKMWICQDHWCIAHCANTHTSWLNTSDAGERWATRPKAYNKEVQRAYKLPCLLMVKINRGAGRFKFVVVSNMWMWPFLCVYMEVTKVSSLGLQPPLLLWTMHHKKPPHNLMVSPLSHAGVSRGPWHQRLIKWSPGWTPRAAWQTGHQTALTTPLHTPSINNACVSELCSPHSCCDHVFLWVLVWHCAPCEP